MTLQQIKCNFVLLLKSNENMRLLLAFSLTLLLFTAIAQDEPESESGARITFYEESFDFGDITVGDVVDHIFEFENSGDQPLIFSNVLTTCGCTAPDWPREPILPGESSFLTITFNSAGKAGVQNKVITIITNAVNNRERIRITTNVLPKS